MQNYITPSVTLDQARMLYRDTGKPTIIVEGDSDKTFFKTMMGDRKIHYSPVNGWEKVRDTIDFAIAHEYFETMGVIDRDYHVLLDDGIKENEQLAFTDQNDLEMMLFLSPSFMKFLTIAASETKLSAIENPRTPILTAASYIGALRALSLQNNYCLCFDEYECKSFVDYRTFDCSTERLVNGIISRSSPSKCGLSIDRGALLSTLNDFVKKYSAESLCNGHDVMDIIGIAMRKLFASANASVYSEDRLFELLLQGYTTEEFQKSELCKKLNSWLNKVEVT